MASRARARLIADGGAAASSEADFFRSPAFLEAERVTHTLELAAPGHEAAVPLIVRELPGKKPGSDAISPYGYPGGAVAGGGDAPAAEEVDWTATGLVSVFARERLTGAAWLGGARELSRVLVHDPTRPRSVRSRLAGQIRANARAGWEVVTTRGPASGPADRDAFATAYGETMAAVGASSRYRFPREYFDAVLAFEASWLLRAERGGHTGAAAIAAVSDGVLHYYLGGTADAARDAAPFKNVVAAMLGLADELGLVLNLGGGVAAGDGLERFKRGFANDEAAYRVHEVVCDPARYAALAGPEASGGFFPAYRAPAISAG